ncbi:MAG: M48 family metallopeptidase [Marinilabiliales bacterium]|nr:M48 family metallopeptidase [Marinilabiliales bacterium]
MNKMKWLGYSWIGIVALGLFLASCAKVPLTGRRQLSLVKESDMMALSLTQYGDFLKANKVSTNKAEAERIRRVGGKIAAAVELYLKEKNLSSQIEGYKWEFNLVESKEVNAWCMPGGKVVVYTGILPLMKNDAQLATVMSHEIAHAIARHGSERMSQQMVAQGFGSALSVALAQKPESTQAIAMAAYGIGSQVGVMLPFSRKHEYEADEMGIFFMAMAGYDPKESIEFWKAMSQNGNSQQIELLSTHPLDVNRINRLQEKMAEALTYYHPEKSRK